MTGLKLRDLSKTYADRKVLRSLNLELTEASFTAVVGPSGQGKSTLLRILAGLDEDFQGQLSFSHPQPRRSFVFQEPNLLPWRRLRENIALPFELDSSLTAAPIDPWLKRLGLEDAAELFPHELSGGMKMRASLARALVSAPELLLMDEALSALDEVTRFDLQEQLRRLWLEKPMTLVFVTHSLSEAVFLSDRVLILRQGQFFADVQIDLPRERENPLRRDPAYLDQVETLGRLLREVPE